MTGMTTNIRVGEAAGFAPLTGRGRVPRKKSTVGLTLSIVWIGAITLAALLAPLLPLPPFDLPIGGPKEPPSFSSIGHWLGTDQFGRSVITRVIYGAQVSLVVATVSGLAAFTLGTFLGSLAGFYRKRIDPVITTGADVVLAFPSLILLIAISAIFTPSFTTMLAGLAFTATPPFIRLARAQTLAWSGRDFVSAARNMGAGDFRIMFREILPNLLPSLAAYLPVVMAALIMVEGSLSFLGLGIPPPQPSWGGMIQAGVPFLDSDPQLVFIPATVIFLTVFSLNQIGDGLRLRYDRTIGD